MKSGRRGLREESLLVAVTMECRVLVRWFGVLWVAGAFPRRRVFLRRSEAFRLLSVLSCRRGQREKKKTEVAIHRASGKNSC